MKAEKEGKNQQTEKTLTSLRNQARKLTNENAAMLDRLRKFGALQQDSRQLGSKVAELQGQLEKVSAERDEMKGLLELAQAQVYNILLSCVLYTTLSEGLCFSRRDTLGLPNLSICDPSMCLHPRQISTRRISRRSEKIARGPLQRERKKESDIVTKLSACRLN